MLAVWPQCQKEFERLVLLCSWRHHLAHLLTAGPTDEDAPSPLLTCVHGLRQGWPHEDLVNVVAFLEKITAACTPYRFEYLKQPLLPRTHHDRELFMGRSKQSRRHITGRKNTATVILPAGSVVAILLGLPPTNHWVDAGSKVPPDPFHHRLHL
jgi:hypothetical protein